MCEYFCFDSILSKFERKFEVVLNSMLNIKRNKPYVVMDLHRLLDPIFKNPTLENAKTFVHIIKREQSQLIANGQEHFILTAVFSLVAEGNDRNQKEIIYHLTLAAHLLISNSHIKTVVSMKTMLIILVKQICIKPEFMLMQPHLSEELKLGSINCFESIFRRCTQEVIKEFFVSSNLNLLAQVLSICENIISTEESKPLRIAAIKCVISVHQVYDESDDSNTLQRQHVADVTFLLIPKLIRTLINVATKTSHNTLITLSISGLTRILYLIFEDYKVEKPVFFETHITENFPNLNVSGPAKTAFIDDRLNELICKKRNENWLATASLQLRPLIQKLKKLEYSDSISIREELYKFSQVLVQKCQRNMASCIPDLLEINVTFYDSECKNVCAFYDEHLFDIAEELFVKHLICMPRKIHTGDENEKAVSFLQLKNFLLFLHAGNRLKILMCNDQIIQKFIDIMISIVELERNDEIIGSNIFHHMNDLSIQSPSKNDFFCFHNTPWKKFKNIQDMKTMNVIIQICVCITNLQHAFVFIVQYLSESIIRNSANCNEALLLIQMFLVNSQRNSHLPDTFYATILDNLMCDFRWQLQTDVGERSECTRVNDCDREFTDSVSSHKSCIKSNSPCKTLTLKEVKNNIVHICLVIETIGYIARKLKDEFQKYLPKFLPRLIEKSSSERNAIRTAALIASEDVKAAFNFSTTIDLFYNNTDYIIHAITVCLRKPNHAKDALRIITETVHHGSIEIMPHLDNIVSNLITESKKLCQSKNSISFLHVFRYILSNIRALYLNSKKLCNIKTKRSIQEGYVSDLWINILKPRKTVEDDMKSDEQKEKEMMESKYHTSKYNDITVNIVKCCIPHISTRDNNTKLLAMETISIGLDIIHENENELLPIIHSVWDVFMQQYIRNNSPAILRYYFHFLNQVASHAKEFINNQDIRQLLQFIKRYSMEISKTYVNADPATLYGHCQHLKTFKELLLILPTILANITIVENDFYDVLNSVVWLMEENNYDILRKLWENVVPKLELFDICSVYVNLSTSHWYNQNRS